MNIDQIRIVLVSGVKNAIYEIQKAKQVSIYQKDEKYILTFVLLDFYKSKILSIWGI